ncbi:MAG: ChrR family anti-sigma-E factor [Shewanella sp.]|nr:ChrR family anti-sigma-E factor [Shewanella sp.]MCF1431710.1 ChrR family anti-sigma-E factor [Shewanella sp.]MCF1459198.1 ChrR family anti-sigma-E factor [Shewanella sp.]
MINFHPNDALLQAHAAGELPLVLSTAVAAHCELCKDCRARTSALNDDFAREVFDETPVSTTELSAFDVGAMLAGITALEPVMASGSGKPPQIEVGGDSYTLPRVFRHQLQENWIGIGKLSRLRLATGENRARASLLHIAPDGEIPSHTHKGQEVTLLLAGEFSDEYSHYQPGDFIVMSSEHEHTPKTCSGCLCYTLVDAPLYFTKGVSKLLNPIGELIY